MNDLFQLFAFLVVALVPGTAESDPSTEGLFFKVPIVADNVTGIDLKPHYTIAIHIKPTGEYQVVSVRIPKGLPILSHSPLGHFLIHHPDIWHQYNPDISYGYSWEPYYYTVDTTGAGKTDGERLGRPYQPTVHEPYTIHASEKCHSVSTVMVANVTRVRYDIFAFAHRAISSPPPPLFVSPPIPNGCDDAVLLRPPFDPPLRQVHDGGILAETVACNDGLVRHVREGGDPLCLRPGTLERLLESGVLVEPPEPPEPPPPLPRGHRELPHRP